SVSIRAAAVRLTCRKKLRSKRGCRLEICIITKQRQTTMEAFHARESKAWRTIPGFRASKPRRRSDEAVRPDGRLSHHRGLFTRVLLTEGYSPVGELRRAFAAGAGGQLLQARGRVDGRPRILARGPKGAALAVPVGESDRSRLALRLFPASISVGARTKVDLAEPGRFLRL